MVTLPASTLARYERFSLYNSPYPAHRRGRAVDLYDGSDVGRSPVAGEVLETRTVRCPSREYAVDEDHLVLVAVDGDCLVEDADDGEHVARILHVDPSVTPGERVAVGDPLGDPVRSGFFGRWVDDHVHLGFRRADQNLQRAGGSLPLSLDVSVSPVAWDGTGRVVETGATYARLDAPTHPGDGWAAIGSDGGVPLDGGLVHYEGGGALGEADGGLDAPVSLLGRRVADADGRHLTWRDVEVLADGERVVGLSLFASRVPFGAKLVAFEHGFEVGDEVRVEIRETANPVRLG